MESLHFTASSFEIQLQETALYCCFFYKTDSEWRVENVKDIVENVITSSSYYTRQGDRRITKRAWSENMEGIGKRIVLDLLYKR